MFLLAQRVKMLKVMNVICFMIQQSEPLWLDLNYGRKQ